MDEQNESKIKWWKIVLWVLFLPIMATIAIVKNKRMKIFLKILIIAVIWMFIFVCCGIIGDDSATNNDTNTTESQGVQTESDTQSVQSESYIVTETDSESTREYATETESDSLNVSESETEESVTVTTNEETTSELEAITQTTSESYDTTESEDTTQKSEKIVYKTPTGKRYHYLKSCAGPNAEEIELDDATKIGLTPCKTCVE
jgi:cytoskeletal protein RodZ